MAGAVIPVVNVDQAAFATAVLEQSKHVPVVVDFWAAWCGPCRALGPTLEKLAREANGAWVLAKIDVDRNQGLARRFGVQGIPAVKAFRDGNVIDEFTGALPESQVRSWLTKIVPSQTDQLVAQAARLEASDAERAVTLYQQVLAQEPTDGRALLGLGRVLTLRNDPAAADVLKRIKAGTPEYAPSQALLELATFLADGAQPVAEARQALEADPASTAARWMLAAALARQQAWPDALRHLLTIVQRDRAFGNDAARRAMLAIFTLLGTHDPEVAHYRQQLASALY